MATNEKDMGKIRKNLDKNREELEKTSKEIKGYGDVISQIIDPQLSDINFDKLSITSDTSNISTSIFNIKGKDKASDYDVSDILYSQISDMNNLSQAGIEDIISAQRHRYKEYEMLAKEMPEIMTAIKRMANDVVNPNGTGISGLNIKIHNNNENKTEEKYRNLLKFFKPLDDISATLSSKRLYAYDLEEEVKKRVRSCLTYGCAVVVTIPYSAIANDLLYNHDVPKSLGESFYYKHNDDFYYNDFEKDIIDGLQVSYENKMTLQNKNLDETLKASGESYNLSKMINDDTYGHNFIDELFYGQSEVDELSMIVSQERDQLIDENNDYKPFGEKADISDLLTTSENSDTTNYRDNEFANLKELKNKKKMKFNIKNIKGCTTDFLDVKRMLPLFIKDVLVGVIMIREENELSNQKLGQSLRMLITPEQINSYTSGSSSHKDRLRKILIDDMGKTLKRNLSKKILRNNPTLLEDIEYLLDELSVGALVKSKIRFIPAEYITLYKVGDGKMGTSLVEESKAYIHAVIHLQKNRLLQEILLNKDRWLFKFPHSNDASGLTRIMDSLKLFKSTMPTFEHITTADQINSTLSSRSVVIVPKLPSGAGGEDLFTIEKMEKTTFEEPNDELLNKLRNSATAPFGYPADTLDPNSNIDFAKKITQLNQNTLMTVMGYQKMFTLPVSEECTRRLRYMTGNPRLEMTVEFDPPRELNDAVVTETLNQIDTLATVYEKLIDEDVSIEEDKKGIAKYYLREKLLSSVLDLELIAEIKEKYIVEGIPTTEIGNI